MQYEILYCNLKGQYKKIRGLFTVEERRIVISALRQANYLTPFFGAVYAMPVGQFTLEWTYADQPEVGPRIDEAPELRSEASISTIHERANERISA